MAERIHDLHVFLDEMIRLLRLMDQCKEVLFRARFREHLSASIGEATQTLEFLRNENNSIWRQRDSEAFQMAGLVGSQLRLKLDSFEADLDVFWSEADLESLESALDKGGTILGSLAGCIPGFGSFAQELVDFLLKELRRRFWGRKRAV